MCDRSQLTSSPAESAFHNNRWQRIFICHIYLFFSCAEIHHIIKHFLVFLKCMHACEITWQVWSCCSMLSCIATFCACCLDPSRLTCALSRHTSSCSALSRQAWSSPSLDNHPPESLASPAAWAIIHNSSSEPDEHKEREENHEAGEE